MKKYKIKSNWSEINLIDGDTDHFGRPLINPAHNKNEYLENEIKLVYQSALDNMYWVEIDEDSYKLGLENNDSVRLAYKYIEPEKEHTELIKAAEDFYDNNKYRSDVSAQQYFISGAEWEKLRHIKDKWISVKDKKPTEYGKYEVYRVGCQKQHYETWNNSGWAYNNNDITHWRTINPPENI